MKTLAKRVDRLEEALITLADLHQKTEESLQKLHEEMLEFKEEMRVFKEEMRAFKDEMRDFKDEMLKFKDEMRDFKDEMNAFKDRMEKEVKRINKQWGELSNKLGTIVEDIVYPGTGPVLKKYFKCDPDGMMSNVVKKRGNLIDEFDIIATCRDRVFLIEVKSTLRKEYIEDAERKVERLKKLFPEFSDKKVILILATLKVSDKVAKEVTKRCIFLMVYREWEYMDIVNFEECKKCSGL